jgi:hypothetical protein
MWLDSSVPTYPSIRPTMSTSGPGGMRSGPTLQAVSPHFWSGLFNFGSVSRAVADWVFASGLLGLACAWKVTTGCGYLAIRRNHRQQHREWMLRSYVVASAFVFFRIFVDLLHAAGVRGPTGPGTPEELKMAAWLCWAVPLLLTEPLIQWRHLRRSTTEAQPPLQSTKFAEPSRL